MSFPIYLNPGLLSIGPSPLRIRSNSFSLRGQVVRSSHTEHFVRPLHIVHFVTFSPRFDLSYLVFVCVCVCVEK